MSYTISSDDFVWAGVDSDMESGTINLWMYTDSDSVLTSDSPIEVLVHTKRYDSYFVDRVRYQMEFDTGVGVRMRLRINDPLVGAADKYSSDIPVTSDGILGWHMFSTSWDIAATSDNIQFYLDGTANFAAGSDTIPSLTVPSSDTFVRGAITGPYRSGAAGVLGVAHLAIWKAAVVSSDIANLYTAMTQRTDIGLTVFQGGSGVTAIFENPTTSTGYVTKFDIRGKRLKVYQPNTYVKRSIDSAIAIGERAVSLDMTYQDSPLSGKDVGDFLISILPTALPEVEKLEFDGHRNSTLQTMAASIEPGDRITLRDTYSGISEDYWVNGCAGHVWAGGLQTITLYVIRTFDVPFWLIGVVGFSEIGQTTYVSI